MATSLTDGISVPFPRLAAACLLALALLLAWVVREDLQRRRIANRLCLAVALLALPWWIGMTDSPVRALALQLLLAVMASLPLIVLFSLRLIGGGDVKLMAATCLWLPAADMPRMVAATAVCGAALGLFVWASSASMQRRRQSVPYGLAIAVGAICALAPAARPILAMVA